MDLLSHCSVRPKNKFDAMNRIWEEWIPEGTAPASAYRLSALASDELLVEFTVTAVVSAQSGCPAFI
jgi:enamine deaminase RidA (YjgF/YER057c/UK114 family)